MVQKPWLCIKKFNIITKQIFSNGLTIDQCISKNTLRFTLYLDNHTKGVVMMLKILYTISGTKIFQCIDLVN